MMDLQDIIAFSLGGANIITMALGIVLSVFLPALERWSKRYFIALFSLMFLCAVVCFLALIFWYDPSKAVASRIIYLFEGLLLATPIYAPTLFLLHYSGEKIKSSVLFWLVTTVLGLYFIILAAAQFTDVFYYVTPDNQFIRGPLWALWMTPLAVCMILNTTGLFYRVKKLPRKYFTALLIYMLYMTAMILIHLFYHVEVPIVIGMALFAFVSFALILSDNMENHIRKEHQIAHQRAEIMMLQMRPHFIFNTMMGIYYLCDQDPKKAKQVTLDFTSYLRKNFAAIASEDTVPFSDELEHTRAYLAVEQAQFEDALFIDFDTPYKAFRIPPLTLQPIVENAVKHGMRSSNDPIYITVATRQMDNAVEIIVEDDGVGFDQACSADDNDPHIALNNIRQRLEMMCKGKLTIAPREGGGTAVKITIPRAGRESVK
ncbi:MAG: histidine kinase [Clostridia bacterium]|nr:histidine kinase [Clostridia bacterium]